MAEVFRRAYEGNVSKAGDCRVSRRAKGRRVKVVAGDPRLVKITEAEDLERVAALL